MLMALFESSYYFTTECRVHLVTALTFSEPLTDSTNVDWFNVQENGATDIAFIQLLSSVLLGGLSANNLANQSEQSANYFLRYCNRFFLSPE